MGSRASPPLCLLFDGVSHVLRGFGLDLMENLEEF